MQPTTSMKKMYNLEPFDPESTAVSSSYDDSSVSIDLEPEKEEEKIEKPNKKRKTRSFQTTSEEFAISLIHSSRKCQSITRISKYLADNLCRKYHRMIINVLNNSTNLVYLCQFLHTCTHDTTKYIWKFMDQYHPNRENQRICFYGKYQIFLYLFIMNLFAPDFTTYVTSEPEVFYKNERDGSRREIVANVAASMTYLFETNPAAAGSFVNLTSTHKELRGGGGDMTHTTDTISPLGRLDPNPSSLSMENGENDENNDDSDNPTLSGQLEDEVEELEGLFREQFQISSHPITANLIGKMTLIINNIYENQELDEVILETRGIQTF